MYKKQFQKSSFQYTVSMCHTSGESAAVVNILRSGKGFLPQIWHPGMCHPPYKVKNESEEERAIEPRFGISNPKLSIWLAHISLSMWKNQYSIT